MTDIQEGIRTITADPERLTQALSKLVENAIKFTDKGSITVSAGQQGNNIAVTVKDTGIGIEKKNLPKLFRKFSQVDTSATRRTKGTGLGLAICKMIIEEHKGKVKASSKGLGKGTTFTFTLPVKKR